MAIDLEARFQDAVQYVFTGRLRQKEKQVEAGRADAGNRGAVTGGGHMGALELLVTDILIECGIEKSEISTKSRLELPGYYRPEKMWDLVVVSKKQLVLAIEFKSQVGSVGKNINNRIEEALGSPTDIWTAYREGRFGKGPSPFLGYFFLLEAHESLSRERERFKEPHFEVDPVFKRASYYKRYEILFQRMVRERIYSSACFVMATDEATTRIIQPAEDLTFRRFVAAIQGHVVTFLGSQA